MDVRYVFMAIIGLFFLVVIVYPLSLVVVKSFSSEAGFTFENYVKVLLSPRSQPVCLCALLPE